SAVSAFADSRRNEGDNKKTNAASSDVSNATGNAAEPVPIRDEKKTDGAADSADKSAADKAANNSTRAASPAPEPVDRMRALEEALKTQNDRLDQMRKTIEEQQQTIKMLVGNGNAAAAGVAPASSSSSGVPVASPANTAAAPTTAATTQNQPPSLEDRLKK